jgi:transposase
MPNRRLSVRKIKEILRLKLDCGISEREIARSCGISRSTVADYLRRAAAAKLTWEEAASLAESQLEDRLFPNERIPSSVKRPPPDCEYIYNELRTYRKFNLTLSQLWLEYKEKHPDGYQYTQFCEHYGRWRKKLDYCMRQEHRGGEKLFIDYADGLSIVDRVTGEIISTQLFLAVWGASNYTYAEASLSQTLPDWIGAHRRALEYFGCAPRVLVPDNLKSGVSKACKYEPELNPTYSDMAEHYGCAVLPARPRKPRDKAKVENGVLIAKRWILAVLRHRTFYSLAELNTAVRECLERLNTRPLKKLRKSRKDLFEAVDRPHALPLPAQPYEYAEWYKAMVQLNYHIERSPLLQRALPALPPEAGHPADGHGRGSLPQGRARGRPCPVLPQKWLYHAPGAYARPPPLLRRVESGAVCPVGGQDRRGYRPAGGKDTVHPSSPGARLQGVPGYHQPDAPLRTGACRSSGEASA